MFKIIISMTFKAALFLAVLFSSIVYSQNGPVLPECPQCETTQLKVLPHNGLWWSPDLSGVGLGIEIQGEKVLGTYYGYNQDGQATWYTFVGKLIPSDDPQVMWDVQANINLFENGVCFNCEYQKPGVTDFNSSIHIQFNQANHASVSINDGEVQNIIPFLFAQNTFADFREQSSFEIPNIQGIWVFSFVELPVNEFNPIQSSVLQLSSHKVKKYTDGSNGFDVTGQLADKVITVLSCRTYLDENNVVAGPVCALFGSIDDSGISDGYYLSIGNIGAHKMIGKKSNGDSIEAFKMEFGRN